ncbi:hypothetical protein QLQ12_45685 [Actinoplanes sp. NEAU-A12]|uniref:Uncharacterized protein n=1 Tax=Actinoplanes sandaracinus TaxID=3045177 RepID=A0ABT6X1N9_9ACTN|nr:hypothetical protein [Actinoplanes sandaracinus]MDI6105888.1 hypothetical protein [Actinoplanes sandaracinus]
MIERSRLLGPVSLQMLNKALGNLPKKPDGAATQRIVDNPDYLFHWIPVPSEADIGIVYRPTKKLGRWTFWIANVHSDQLPEFHR